jgi:hypothetical protein
LVTTIRIVDLIDTAKPTVKITAPAANANVMEGASVLLTGTASDNKGVLNVQVALNGGAFANAVTTISTNGLSATYTATITPIPGVNLLSVKSIDTRNNESTIVTRSFNSIVMRPLTVAVDGTGTVPLPIAATSYRVGFPYTLKAKPGTGQVFDSWTANDLTGTGITSSSAELPSLVFTHREGLVLTAHFISNPFTADVIGTFNGLVMPMGTTATSNETVGFLMNAKVMGNGTFTSTLKIDGLSKPVVGTFDNSGVARFGRMRSTTLSLARTGKPSLDVALQLDMNATVSKITGSVTQSSNSAVIATSAVDADRALLRRVSGIDLLQAQHR